MSDLPTRAADPTLADVDDHVIIAWSETPPVAHLYGCHDSSPVLQSIPTEAACWFAVPCRECFPDAPPPGHAFVHGPTEESKANPYPLPLAPLSWQVARLEGDQP